MKSLTFTVKTSPAEKHVELTEVTRPVISDPTWQKLANNIAQEESLTSYPAAVLARRWEQGYAAIALKDDEIVSYTSVVPLFFTKTRQALSRELGIDYSQWPKVDMYEFASGWTHPSWRRKGISLQLRHDLLGQLDRSDCLIASISVGLGASYVLEKLGWQIAAWSKIAYVTGLIGLPTAGLEGEIQKIGWPLPPPLKRYEGKPVSPSQNPEHHWNDYCHFWISDLALAKALNHQLETLLETELHRWHEAVVEIIDIPAEFGWKPILFQNG